MTPAEYRRRAAHLDLEALGLGRGTRHSDYIATPIGTNVFAWAGVDGIHFGLIRGQGETVFAISPDNIPGTCIHPVARDMAEFLRLVLATGGTAAIEQTWLWDEAAFDAYLAQDPPGEAQEAALEALQAAFGLTPMPDPYAYIRAVQADFDESVLPLRPEYRRCAALHDDPPAPIESKPWRVTFRHGRGRSGKCIEVNAAVEWAGIRWSFPAAYACGEGLVLDCITPGNEAIPDFRIDAVINGEQVRMTRGSGLGYLPDCGDREAAAWVARYALDPERAWQLHRFAFPWPNGERPKSMDSLCIALSAYPADRFAGQYHLQPGESLTLMHPLTGEPYVLVVAAIAPKLEAFPGRDDLPTHCLVLTYTLTPDLSSDRFTLRDAAPHDRPRDGDDRVAILFAVRPDQPAAGHSAASSLHFAPVAPESVTWKAVFREKPCADGLFPLI